MVAISVSWDGWRLDFEPDVFFLRGPVAKQTAKQALNRAILVGFILFATLIKKNNRSRNYRVDSAVTAFDESQEHSQVLSW